MEKTNSNIPTPEELKVYIALRFEPEQVPGADILNLMADSLQIGPVGTM